MRRSIFLSLSCAVVMLLGSVPMAAAQVLGPFSWQLQPFCNTVTFTITPIGSVFRLDGVDGQCSASRRAAVTGMAVPNPDGTIGLGFTIVSTQGGQAVHVDAFITLATLGGSWSDSQGNSGQFVFGGVGDGPNILPIGASVVTKSVGRASFIGRRGNGVTPGQPILITASSPRFRPKALTAPAIFQARSCLRRPRRTGARLHAGRASASRPCSTAPTSPEPA